MVCTFMYMDFMIMYKWLNINYENTDKGRLAPSIITLMIDIPLKLGKPGDYKDGEGPMPLYGELDGEYQQSTQIKLLLFAVICIPWILVLKPLVIRYRMKKGGLIKITRSDLYEDEGHKP